MRIGIGTKLTSAFLLILFLMSILALYSLKVSGRALKNAVSNNCISLAEHILHDVDNDIYHKINDILQYCHRSMIQQALFQSNQDFADIDNPEEYMNQKDKVWISALTGEQSGFIKEILNNKLSDQLRNDFILFWKKKHGYKIYEEVFITNKYGAIIAATNRTSDYKQDDEEWWQVARDKNFYIGSDIEYDESSGVNCLPISVRINNKEGDFIGLIKALISLDTLVSLTEMVSRRCDYASRGSSQ